MAEGLRVEKLVVGDLETNCYLCWDEKSMDGLVIDPGDEGDFISEKILERQINLRLILLTHGHYDHVLGLLPLVLNFQVPVYINQKDMYLLKTADKRADHWQGTHDPVPTMTLGMNEGAGFFLGENRLRVLETPGHTPGSVCLLSKENKICFCGDLWFKHGIGRGNVAKSLARIKKECKGWMIYPGHEEEFWG